MPKVTLVLALTLLVSHLDAQPCTLNNPSGCECLDGSTDCDLLPDITVSRDLLLDPVENIEYPQSGAGQNNGLLRISVSTPNIGHGPLTVRSTSKFVCGSDTFTGPPPQNFLCPDSTFPRTIIDQRVYHKNGNTMTYTDRPAGTMTYHKSHGHMHVDDWGVYTLRLRDSNETDPLKWPIIGDGSKLGFCLMDFGTCSDYSGHCRDAQNNILQNSSFKNFNLGGGSYFCSANVQGISVGWTDIYHEYLDGMSITIPPTTCNGQYYIVVHVDPYNYFLEENEDNNVIAVPFELKVQQPAGSSPHTSIGATGSFAVGDTVRICNGEFVKLTASAGHSYAWSTGDLTRSINVSGPGLYSVTVSAPCGTASTTVEVVLDTGSAVPPITTGNTVCVGEAAELSATGIGTIKWYDNALGGMALHTGNIFTTPPLDTTTTYYAETSELAGRIAHVGPPDSALGTGGYSNVNQWLLFDVEQPVKLASVLVHANGSSARTIQLRDRFGVVLHDTAVFVPSGQQRVQLGFPMNIGTDYQLGIQSGSSASLWRNTGGASFPYHLEGTVKIRGASGGSNTYYYFYDWELQLEDHLCGSLRTPATAMVNPLPVVMLNGLDSAYHPSHPPVTMTGTPSGGFFSGTGVVANTFDPGLAGVGDHHIIYAYVDANDCSNTDTKIVHVGTEVGVDQLTASAQLRVVPNVGDGRFEVRLSVPSGDATLRILDASGREVESHANFGTTFTKSFDFSDMSAGVFLVQARWSVGELRERLVVINK